MVDVCSFVCGFACLFCSVELSVSVVDWSSNEMQAVWLHVKRVIFFLFSCLAVAQLLTETCIIEQRSWEKASLERS